MTDTETPVARATTAVPDPGCSPTPHARWLAIHNPAAGGSRSALAWNAVERALIRAGVRFEVATTAGPGDGERIAEVAATEGIDRFLVAGGDGSVHDTVNGLMRLRARTTRPWQPTVMPIPLGTGNDWARSLALPRDPARLARIVRDGVPRPHDVGVVRFPGREGATRWFVNVAGAGLDAHVISQLPVPTPSPFAYLVGALRALGRYRVPQMHATCDSGIQLEGRFLLAFVAIGRYCGHRMLVAPAAQPDDGLFDLVTVEEVDLWRALPKLVKLYRGTLLHDPLVRHVRTAGVRLEGDPAAPVEADGQFIGATPAEFSVESRAIRVLCGR